MQSPEDHEHEVDLLRRTASGDKGSFEELYRRYTRVLYSSALKILNNEQEAMDVVQDVFLQIWDKAALYDRERGKPLTWAMTLTRNRAIDRLRSLQRRGKLYDDAEKEADTLQVGFQQGSDEEADTHERGRIIRGAVMQLSREQREAIELAFFGGLTQHEVADRLHEPLGTVKARIRRGMLRLRELVKDQL